MKTQFKRLESITDPFLKKKWDKKNALDVAIPYVSAKRNGRNYVGLCPFHNENTPSFVIYDNGYKCFGCGWHGDVIDFIMEIKGISFTEARKETTYATIA